MIVILDSGILDLLTSPLCSISKENEKERERGIEIRQCTEWLYKLTKDGVYVVTSDICYYEVRREFVRIESQGVQILERFRDFIDFLPLTVEVMKKATELWAEARKNHSKTANDKDIDADMIVSAHWKLLCEEHPGRAVFIATKNIRHLKLFAKEQAADWVNLKF